MVKYCCVKNCITNKEKGKNKNGISLHIFPATDPNLIKRWVEFLGYGNNWKPGKYTCICSRHFKKADYSVHTNVPRLLQNAVPSIKVNSALDNKIEPLAANEASCNDINSTLITTDEPSTTLSVEQTDQIEDNDLDKQTHIEVHPNEEQKQSEILLIISDAQTQTDETYQDQETVPANIVQEICRLCGHDFNFSINNIFEIDNTYALRVSKFLQLTILPNDLLPKTICYACEKKFNEFEIFFKQVQKAQNDLSNRFDLKITKLDVDESYYQHPTEYFENPHNENYNYAPTENVSILIPKHKEDKFLHTNMYTRLDLQNESCVNHLRNTNCFINPINSYKTISFSDDRVDSSKLSGNFNFSNVQNASNVSICKPEKMILKTPIKLETMTPSTELHQISHVAKPPGGNTNKKIEILEHIKLIPNQLDFTSIKTICNESILNINKGLQKNANCEKISPSFETHNKIENIPNLLSNSNICCKYCKKKFISKYALNHHLKFLCDNKTNKPIKVSDCKVCKLRYSNNSLLACTCSQIKKHKKVSHKKNKLIGNKSKIKKS